MTEDRPAFITKICGKYDARAGNIFLLHGNIHDIFHCGEGAWKALRPLLTDWFSTDKNRIFIYIDLSEGFTVLPVWPSALEDLPETEQKEYAAFPKDKLSQELKKRREANAKEQVRFLRELCGYTALARFGEHNKGQEQESLYDTLDQASIQMSFAGLTLAQEILERLEQKTTRDQWRIVFLINDIETIAPAQSEGNLSESDRRNIQLLQKWFGSPEFLASRHAVVMTAANVEGVSGKLRSLPQLLPVKIWRPNREERHTFLENFLLRYQNEIVLDKEFLLDNLTEATAGLTLRDIEQLLFTVKFGAKRDSEKRAVEPAVLKAATVTERAREVMEQSAGGYIEFLELDYGLEEVIGQERLKPRLEKLATLFRKGRRAAIPNGILIPGPNGSGKSFVIKGFARDTGWLVIRLKNIRNMWYGETERIWEVIEEIIEAIGRVIIMVDEGDTELGGRGQNVHEVDKRLFGKILRMMEDKKNKGRVCWIIVTARPDKLEPDIKRSGRAGRHYPVFAPETQSEREEFLVKTILKRFGLLPNAEEKKLLLERTEKYYPADFDHLIEAVEERRESNENGALAMQDILEETISIRPADPILQRKLQIYVALLECTDDRLVPEQYQELVKNREVLVKEIITLKTLLGEVG